MIDHIRKTSEAIILLLVVVSPWTFGSVHPYFRYCLTAGIVLLLLLWAVELLMVPRKCVSRYQIPILAFLGIVCLQLVPTGGLGKMLSPTSAALKRELLPTTLETLANGSPPSRVALPARGRISLYPAETLRRFYWFALLGLLFTRVQDLASTTTLRRLCYVCLINGSVLAYFSIIQYFTASDEGVVFWIYQSRGAAFGPFINRNHFAFYINICFGLSLGLLGSRQMGKFSKFTFENVIESLKDSLSLWMVSVLVFMLGAVILCSSRGGLVSLLGAMLITAIFVASTGTFRRGWGWFMLAALIFGLAAGVQIWLGFDFVDSRYAFYGDNRTEVWLPLLKIVYQFPLLGSGLGTLAHVEPLTRDSGTVRDFYLEYAHNEYLQLAVETGLLGLCCGLGFLWLLATKISNRVRGSRHNAWLYVGLLFSLSAIALHNVTEFGMAIPSIALLAVVVAGHIAGVGRIKSDRAESEAQKWLYRSMAVGMLVLGFFAIREAKLADLAERYFVAAQRAHNEGNVDEEVAYYEEALSYTPENIELLLDSSRLLLEAKHVAETGPRALLLKSQNDLIAVRELCPLSSDAHFLIGRHVETFAEAEDRLVHYLRARKTRPADATLAFITGMEYLHRDQRQDAAQQFRDSLTLAPTHLREILPLGDQEFMEQQVLPSDAKVLALAADWYESAGAQHLALCQRLRDRALQTDELTAPHTGDAHHLKAELLAKLDNPQAAAKSYRAALLYAPLNLTWRFQLARLLVETQQFGDAHEQIRQILRQKPDYPPALRLRAEVLAQQAEH